VLSSLLADGVSGYLGVGVSHMSIKDNFYHHKDNDKISSLKSSPKSEKETMPIPLVDMKYKNIFLESDLEEFDLNLGYNITNDLRAYITTKGIGADIKRDKLYANYKVYRDKMYTNPYQVGKDRESKYATNHKLKIGYSNIANIFGVEYKAHNIDIDDKLRADAKQSGTKHEMALMYHLPSPNDYSYANIGLLLGKGIFDGDSNDYNKYGLKYSMEWNFKEVNQLELEAVVAKYKFDKENSYFNKTRDEKEAKIYLSFTRDKFLCRKNLFANLTVGYNKLESNIDFHDKSNTFSAFSVGYKF
jgi:hypothetical protein